MTIDLKGQTAIITGSSTGLGRACAIGLAREGMNVVINYHSSDKEAKEVRREIEAAGGRAIAVQADVSKEEEVIKLFEACHEEYGHLDLLVANAGLQADAAFTEMTLEQWNRVISVDLTGQFLCCREAARIFRRQGVHEHSSAAGKIICMSSVHDEIAWAGHVNYAAAKGGVKMMMESMAQELAGDKIRINSISPGAIRTEINRAAWEGEDAMNELLKLIPYGRIGEAEDVANLCTFLASDASDYITGATIYIDGGMMLYPGFRFGG
ncbi:glucose 1-dehydrogenase [Lewinella marina]|uniref:Sugar dehydrogenase n=1 Tax=Neolewinella marina TaxID=438751 RepID=A0A2G0CIU6_9BACT|nr:SDR family oxidoreductase [Neolewinella marina]NJB84958.1 glucose 1-dehydrogenase [Neolewinella marina]PHK99889.1 sugar dehydrogenase [Neolewinella marina]